MTHAVSGSKENEAYSLNHTKQNQTDPFLPIDDLVLHIFSYLPYPSLCRIASVSKRFKALSENDQLWRNLYFAYSQQQGSLHLSFSFIQNATQVKQRMAGDFYPHRPQQMKVVLQKRPFSFKLFRSEKGTIQSILLADDYCITAKNNGKITITHRSSNEKQTICNQGTLQGIHYFENKLIYQINGLIQVWDCSQKKVTASLKSPMDSFLVACNSIVARENAKLHVFDLQTGEHKASSPDNLGLSPNDVYLMVGNRLICSISNALYESALNQVDAKLQLNAIKLSFKGDATIENLQEADGKLFFAVRSPSRLLKEIWMLDLDANLCTPIAKKTIDAFKIKKRGAHFYLSIMIRDEERLLMTRTVRFERVIQTFTLDCKLKKTIPVGDNIIDFDAQDTIIAVSTADSITLWDLTTGKALQQIQKKSTTLKLSGNTLFGIGGPHNSILYKWRLTFK